MGLHSSGSAIGSPPCPRSLMGEPARYASRFREVGAMRWIAAILAGLVVVGACANKRPAPPLTSPEEIAASFNGKPASDATLRLGIEPACDRQLSGETVCIWRAGQDQKPGSVLCVGGFCQMRHPQATRAVIACVV